MKPGHPAGMQHGEAQDASWGRTSKLQPDIFTRGTKGKTGEVLDRRGPSPSSVAKLLPRRLRLPVPSPLKAPWCAYDMSCRWTI